MNEMRNTPIHQYSGQMVEIKHRTDALRYFHECLKKPDFKIQALESMCLQVRKILELIAMSSLIANKDAYIEMYEEFEKHQDARKLLHALEKVNENFYPIPIIQELSEDGSHATHRLLNKDYLTKKDFVKVYEKCGRILHTPNPYRSKVDFEYYEINLPTWDRKIIELLNVHEVNLTNLDEIWVFHMKKNGDKDVHYYQYKKTNI